MINSAAVFLDRDGTVIEETGYLSNPKQVKLLNNTPDALLLLHRLGFKLVMVTNQSGVARGMFEEERVIQVHHELTQQLMAHNVFLDGYYYCPHHPNGSVDKYRLVCTCRKPQTGLLLNSARDLEINLRDSWIVGDKISDVITGNQFGVKGILVLTGLGREQVRFCPEGVPVVRDLFEAAKYIKKARGSTTVNPKAHE